MIDFGFTLRQARELKGLTTKQIAETTHMMEQMVRDLENEDFGQIAAPIYGRGFVKLYCEAVGLDPKPLVAEFMEIFNGNRPATIRRRDEAPTPSIAKPQPPVAAPLPTPEPEAPLAAPEPSEEFSDTQAATEEVEEAEDGIISAAGIQVESEPEPAAAFTAPEPPPQPEDPLFAFAQQPQSEPPRVPEPVPAPLPRRNPIPAAEPEDEGFARLSKGPSRFSAPLPIDDEPRRGFSLPVPPIVWRMLVLVGAALFLLWLIILLLRALCSALSTPPSAVPEPTPAAQVQTPQPTAPAPANPTAAPAPRKPIDIPPLYID